MLVGVIYTKARGSESGWASEAAAGCSIYVTSPELSINSLMCPIAFWGSLGDTTAASEAAA